MPLRPHGGGRRERDWQSYADTYSGFSVFCRSHFRSVRLSGKAPAERSPEVYLVVLLPFPGSGNWNRLGHVSVFSLEARPRFGSFLIRANVRSWCGECLALSPVNDRSRPVVSACLQRCVVGVQHGLQQTTRSGPGADCGAKPR
jgi:hypothetical protein